MKLACSLLVLLFLQGGMSAVVRKPPAFSKPTYSDSYLPAAMQVIFHTVEQLKLVQSEEAQQNTSTSFIPVSMITQTTAHPEGATSSSNQETNSNSSLVSQMESTPASAATLASSTEAMNKPNTEEDHDETPEVNEETPEAYYATPEANHEPTEVSHGVQESNHEIPEENHEVEILSMIETSTLQSPAGMNELPSTVETEASGGTTFGIDQNLSTVEMKTEASTSGSSISAEIDLDLSTVGMKKGGSTSESSISMEMETNPSIVEMKMGGSVPQLSISTIEMNEDPLMLEKKTEASVPQFSSSIVTTRSPVADVEGQKKKKEPTIDSIVEEIYEIVKPTPSSLLEETDVFEESKSSSGISLEKLESIEEAEDETRFTLLGEKVTQVPRPSLSSYLRRAKVPASASLQQLAALYDALSKDARKQGFGRYSGYSDQVLETLRTSAEGGIGPQLRVILGKVMERNELTKEDAKMKTSQALRDLDEPSSSLSKDLRRLLPLRYTP
ncbi:hypothetical protein KM043_003518 [Ampulex compressa]|nr:hypothetical protein KM043_003518 [Ampulex compressa]